MPTWMRAARIFVSRTRDESKGEYEVVVVSAATESRGTTFLGELRRLADAGDSEAAADLAVFAPDCIDAR